MSKTCRSQNRTKKQYAYTLNCGVKWIAEKHTYSLIVSNFATWNEALQILSEFANEMQNAFDITYTKL